MRNVWKVVIIVGLLICFYVVANSFETKYTITYKGSDGSVLATEQLNYEGFDSPPSREGYTFVRWEKSTSNMNPSVIANAIYEKNKYNVVFKDNKGNVFSVQSVEHGSDAVAPMINDKPGHTFTGWDKSYTNVKANMVIIAQFDIEQVRVNISDEDGNIIGSINVDYGAALNAVAAPYKEGYNFVGWDKELSEVNEDIIVTPIYERKSYQVSFKDDNGNLISKQTVYHGDDALAPRIYNIDGKTFKGWDKDFDSIKSNLEVIALYDCEEYEVVFKDYDNRVIEVQTVSYGKDAIPPSTIEREGYDFIGWDQSFNNITKDIEIRPIYELKTYQVVFRLDDGSIISSQEVKHGNSAKTPIVEERIGYEFIGWDKDYSYITSDLLVIGSFKEKQDEKPSTFINKVVKSIYYSSYEEEIKVNDEYGDVVNDVEDISLVDVLETHSISNNNSYQFKEISLFKFENNINLDCVTLSTSGTPKLFLNDRNNRGYYLKKGK